MSDTSLGPIAVKQSPHKWRRRGMISLITVAVLGWPGVRLLYYGWITTVGGVPFRPTDFSQLSRVLPPADARLVVVYSGLPHQHEHKLLLQALFTRSHLSIGGCRFYSSPLSLPADMGDRLSDELRNAARYYSYSGPKLCGGYHPDYCFVWESSRGVFTSLLCTGCDEIIMIGGGAELRCDVDLRKDTALDQRIKKLDNLNPGGSLSSGRHKRSGGKSRS